MHRHGCLDSPDDADRGHGREPREPGPAAIRRRDPSQPKIVGYSKAAHYSDKATPHYRLLAFQAAELITTDLQGTQNELPSPTVARTSS